MNNDQIRVNNKQLVGNLSDITPDYRPICVLIDSLVDSITFTDFELICRIKSGPYDGRDIVFVLRSDWKPDMAANYSYVLTLALGLPVN